MSYNESETRFYLIDPVLRSKGYDAHWKLKMETPAPVEPTGNRGRRRTGGGRTDYLLCVQAPGMQKPLPVGVLEAKAETRNPEEGVQQRLGHRREHRRGEREQPIRERREALRAQLLIQKFLHRHIGKAQFIGEMHGDLAGGAACHKRPILFSLFPYSSVKADAAHMDVHRRHLKAGHALQRGVYSLLRLLCLPC